MRPTRILLLASASALVVGLAAAPVAAEPDPGPTSSTQPPDTTQPPTTTAPPDTTLPPDTTARPETTVPPAPDTAIPELDAGTESHVPNPHKPKPIATRDSGIGFRGDRRVLLIGNSIMGQAGPKVEAFFDVLEGGIPLVRESVGSSSLFSKNQFRKGKTHVKVNDPGSGATFNWLLRAQQLVDSFNPSVTVVEFGYNYKAPFPKWKNGVEIQPGSSEFVKMARKQAKALTNILRSRGGQVLFVSPLPLNNATAATNMNAAWQGFESARAKKHFGVLWAGDALDGNNGAYTQIMTECGTSNHRTVRDSDGLHLTTGGASPNGADLMGEAMYRGLKKFYGLNRPNGTYFC